MADDFVEVRSSVPIHQPADALARKTDRVGTTWPYTLW